MNTILLENSKLAQDTTISVFSDLHYQAFKYSAKYLEYILKKIKIACPDYICIAGDIFEQAEDIEMKPLLDFFKLLLIFCKKDIFIIYGNHDLMTKQNGMWIQKDPTVLFQELANLSPKIHILKNDSYLSSENIRFIGAFADFDFYEKYHEDPEFVIEYFSKAVPQSFDKKSCNILLTHSPVILRDEIFHAIDAMNCVDYILCGHYHGGMVPEILKPFFPKNKGLISPYLGPLPSYSRGIIQKENTTAIISEGIVKAVPLQKGYARAMNLFYKPDVKFLKLVSK